MYKKEVETTINALFNQDFKDMQDFILDDLINFINEDNLEIRQTNEYKEALMTILKDKEYMLKYGLKFIDVHSNFNFKGLNEFFDELDDEKKEDFVKQFVNI